MYTYNLLVWKWINNKFDMKWMYLLCFIFVDTAFLLCGAAIQARYILAYLSLLIQYITNKAKKLFVCLHILKKGFLGLTYLLYKSSEIL